MVFNINNSTVFDPSKLTFNDLKNGLYVLVKAIKIENSFVVSKINVRNSSDNNSDSNKTELHGSIVNFQNNSNFFVRDVNVDASKSEISFSNCPNKQALEDNMQVVVLGTVSSNGVLLASNVRCEKPTVNAVVPNGYTYQVTGASNGYYLWAELS